MKIIILGLLITFNLYANIIISQNIRALYKDVQLTETQKDYILDNQDENIDIFQKVLKKEMRKFKNLHEKNIISFIIDPYRNVTKIRFLKHSENRKLDKATKKAIYKATALLARPTEKTEIRYIISYTKGQQERYENSNYSSHSESKPYYKEISRGTTRFQHTSKEYVRIFETNEDGFINLNVSPNRCINKITLLTMKNQKITTVGTYNAFINKEVPKGKYKLLIKTNKTCDVNLEYL